MKKTLLFAALFCCFLLIAPGVQAQQGKYGHINSGEVLKAMPGVDSISIKFQAFHNELQALVQDMLTEFQTKQDRFNREAGTMSSGVRQIREKELVDLQNRIQETQYTFQEDLDEKQYELLRPFQEKIQNAIEEVAKENNFAYIFDTQVLLYYDGGNDVTPLVKKKLGLN